MKNNIIFHAQPSVEYNITYISCFGAAAMILDFWSSSTNLNGEFKKKLEDING